MPGEKQLPLLLQNMNPSLHDGVYVFCSVKEIAAIDYKNILGTFKEKEGITVIVAKETADFHKWEYFTEMAWISLTVQSSLEAVGLTAAFSTALTQNGISCNVVAAYYHDHIFVKKEAANKAMQVLQKMEAYGQHIK